MIIQFTAALLGTASFAVLFCVPKEYCITSGIVGAIGWMVYCLLIKANSGMELASFVAAAAVVFAARGCAVLFSCPSTTFLIPGIFPLVPGGGVYWTAYYLVRRYPSLAFEHGFAALRCAFCIVLGIVVVLELPEKVFHIVRHSNSEERKRENEG